MPAKRADPAWIRALQARADRPPAVPRVPLVLDAAQAEVGSIDAALAQRLAGAGLPVQAQAQARCCVVTGAADASLEALARWLAAMGLGGRWRDERLAVTDANGRVHAAIERAAVRPLGIATHAVHLVGLDDDGRHWLQQRAPGKAVDPGLWDTLVGGLVSHGESALGSLERETWEEAGLRLGDLQGLARLGRVTVRRPIDDGYMVERMDLFQARLPGTMAPANQDGEVQAFERLSETALRERLRAGRFTLEAALALLVALGEIDAQR
jgi:8-oxo-dGTP pyrophosphatase MutT (NUDIX family)